ncbi:hypothetical protein L1987_08666 [Smallanthus sonchifolius]|uniref:Uncharacterized protein n=1 Tax=Smallanthus sonchifolius TaxID=185202 RepID=A0ACB9JKV3_9ASTR|nr:hypothetical protein L1987_08666 [Smallanthus sonchifolius]
MTHIIRPSTLNKLKPLLQQRYAKADFNTFRPQHHRLANRPPSKDLLKSIRNQTHVSTTLATHLLSKEFPNSNVVFSPLSIHVALSIVAADLKDGAADEVNLWAEKQTNGIIKQVISANAIDDLTWLIFSNAVYFKGEWVEKFEENETEESDFHLLDGNKVQVPFMTNDEDQFVREYEDFKVLGLPYLQGQDIREFTMYFFLPHAKDGLQSLIEKIGSTSDFFNRHIPRQKVKVGEFLIPKFKISFGFEASNMLKDLGLVLPFNHEDGMTEMVDSSLGQRVYVSDIYQKSFVEVNEEGTEATSVSACFGRASSPMTKYDRVDFVADHPFLFVVREDVTNVVLFMGQVIDPRVDRKSI